VSEVTFGISPECLCHDVRDNVQRVRALEEAGFQYIWEGDHTLPWQHSSGHSSGIFVTLTAFLERTERAVVGGVVIPPIALCVGTGEAMNEKTTTGFWPPLRERIERCIEAIELIRKAWESEDYFRHKGKYFNSFFYLYTKPAERIPLLCAAQGPIMARNAGLYSDGYVAVGVPPAHHHDVLIPAFEQGAREGGKDTAALMRCAWVSTFYHPDPEQALNGARAYGGLLIPEAYNYIQDPRVIEQRALLVRDEALRQAFCIASTAEEVVDAFQGFIEAGCNHIVWADGSPDPALVAPLGRDGVLPILRERRLAPAAAL
jgi:coenzyme F420-dependent glucose-6-phosphate dehydrogenase